MPNDVFAAIPCYNPGQELVECLISLRHQSIPLSLVVLVDSSPVKRIDNLLASVKDKIPNYLVSEIPAHSFDHGGTRTYAANLLEGPFNQCLMVSQDVKLDKYCLENLLEFSHNNNASAVCARQLAKNGSNFIERVEREYNYPSTSYTLTGVPQSIKSLLLSNACTLYNMADLMAVGGFVKDTPSCEDILTAATLLKAGFTIGYCSTAIAVHSHSYSLADIFKRYFDIGTAHSMFKRILPPLGGLSGKGTGFVRYAFRESQQPFNYLETITTSIAKYLGYRFGRMHDLLPKRLRLKFSQNHRYWLNKEQSN